MNEWRTAKYVLINPSSMRQYGYAPPPLGLLYIASQVPGTAIIDLAHNPNFSVSNYLSSVKPEIVGVPIYTAGRKESFELLKLAHDAGCRTVAGGPHVDILQTLNIDTASLYSYIDYYSKGFGESNWKEIVEFEGKYPGRKRPMLIKHGEQNEETLNSFNIPNYNLIDHRNYDARQSMVRHHRGNDLSIEPRYSVVFGRGCLGSCAFCSTWWVNGKYIHHSIEWMEKFFDHLWEIGAKHLCFQDDCLTSDKDACIELFNLMAQKYKFSCFGTTRVDMFDEEIAYHAKAAGFYEFSFGVESGSQQILASMNKKTDVSKAMIARDAARKHDIKFTALMIDGYPGETEKTIKETRKFLQELHPDGIGTLGYTMVLPGTKLYSDMKAKGFIDDEFWTGDEPYYIYKGE